MADDLLFPTRQRGDTRKAWLEDFAAGLRQMRDPRTGLAFTEDQIAAAIAKGSRDYIRADGIDAVTFLNQQRALWMAAQNRPDLAAGITLRDRWANIWELPYLGAAGGSGWVEAPCAGGTIFKGSAIVGDPIAVQGRDPNGRRYQVLTTRAAGPGATSVALELIAIDVGPETNIDLDTPMTWTENVPITAPVEGTVVTIAFVGGIDEETDADYAIRLVRHIRHRPGSGNPAEVIEWVEQAGQNAVGRTWVFRGAFHAGSTLVIAAAKRGVSVGPRARIPTVGLMARISAYLAGKIPATPGPPAVLALPPVAIDSDMVLSLSMARESASGWTDAQPWPGQDAGVAATVISVTNQTHFTLTTTLALPSGGVPSLMVWDDPTSAFFELAVASVTLGAPDEYAVVLAGAPTGHTLVVDDMISPHTEQHELLAATLTAYADSLGAGEIVDASPTSMDDRAGYAFRYPKPNEGDPPTMGTGAISYLQDALGAALANTIVESVSVTDPPVPADPLEGPGLLVLGKIGIYAA